MTTASVTTASVSGPLTHGGGVAGVVGLHLLLCRQGASLRQCPWLRYRPVRYRRRGDGRHLLDVLDIRAREVSRLPRPLVAPLKPPLGVLGRALLWELGRHRDLDDVVHLDGEVILLELILTGLVVVHGLVDDHFIHCGGVLPSVHTLLLRSRLNAQHSRRSPQARCCHLQQSMVTSSKWEACVKGILFI